MDYQQMRSTQEIQRRFLQRQGEALIMPRGQGNARSRYSGNAARNNVHGTFTMNGPRGQGNAWSRYPDNVARNNVQSTLTRNKPLGELTRPQWILAQPKKVAQPQDAVENPQDAADQPQDDALPRFIQGGKSPINIKIKDSENFEEYHESDTEKDAREQLFKDSKAIHHKPRDAQENPMTPGIGSDISADGDKKMKYMTPEMRGGILAYVGGSYDQINKYLRDKYTMEQEGKTGDVARVKDSIKTAAKNIHAALDIAPTIKKNMIVYRGCSRYLTIGGNQVDLKSAKDKEALQWKGKTIMDAGFMSTSVNLNTAMNHCTKASNPGSLGAVGGALLIIHVPEGKKALYITPEYEKYYTEEDDKKEEARKIMPGKQTKKVQSPNSYRKEGEILFKDGQEIKITDVSLPKRREIQNFFVLEGDLQLRTGRADTGAGETHFRGR